MGKPPRPESGRVTWVDFRVLGPLEAGDERESLALGPRKQRAVLVRLLLDVDRTVSVDRLLDDLWGDELPGTAVKMVQIYVSGLRKVAGQRAVGDPTLGVSIHARARRRAGPAGV